MYNMLLKGIEPSTFCLQDSCSTIKLKEHKTKIFIYIKRPKRDSNPYFRFCRSTHYHYVIWFYTKI